MNYIIYFNIRILITHTHTQNFLIDMLALYRLKQSYIKRYSMHNHHKIVQLKMFTLIHR